MTHDQHAKRLAAIGACRDAQKTLESAPVHSLDFERARASLKRAERSVDDLIEELKKTELAEVVATQRHAQ